MTAQRRQQTRRLPRRQLLARVRQLLDHLAALLAQPSHDAAAVHAIRVTCKRLRAWIRLVRHADKHTRWRAADRRLRVIGKHFGGRRDAEVMAATLARVRRACADPAEGRQLEALEPTLATEAARRSDSVPRLTAAHHAALLAPPAPLPVLAALARSHQHAFARHRRLTKRNDPEELHAWRKRVKYLYYQLALCRADDSPPTPVQKALKKLGSTLGRIQDLTQLRRRLKPLQQDPTLAAAARLARRLASQQRDKLAARAGPLGAAAAAMQVP